MLSGEKLTSRIEELTKLSGGSTLIAGSPLPPFSLPPFSLTHSLTHSLPLHFCTFHFLYYPSDPTLMFLLLTHHGREGELSMHHRTNSHYILLTPSNDRCEHILSQSSPNTPSHTHKQPFSTHPLTHTNHLSQHTLSHTQTTSLNTPAHPHKLPLSTHPLTHTNHLSQHTLSHTQTTSLNTPAHTHKPPFSTHTLTL